jgi:glycosyltransferase involved in cell wall biosynthesis
MQGIAETVFWAGVALVVYTYLGYPLLVAALARLRPAVVSDGTFAGSVSVILAARDEERTIAARVEQFAQMLRMHDRRGEIIVVSDGSTDGTAARARCGAGVPVRVIELHENLGKAAALSLAAEQASGDVLVLADVRQRWAADALERLVRPFSDARFGAASGELVIEREDGVMAGVGMYWKYEKWLRQNEARLHSTVGVSGSISAVRRSLFSPIPAGTLLDDVYWPLQVAMQGHRVAFVADAHAYDRLPSPKGEFRRKVRTLAGNFQLMALLPRALLPWANPISLQFFSHKILRLFVPWALIAMLLASVIADGLVYRAALAMQVLLYTAGAIALFTSWLEKSSLASAAGSFMLLNAAAWLGFFTWASGRATRSWKKVDYEARRGAPKVGAR